MNLASLPPIFSLAAFASSIARRAPFSLSLPRWAMPPVSGATWPILISTEGAGGGAEGCELAACSFGFSGSLPQPSSVNAAATDSTNAFFIAVSQRLSFRDAYDTRAPVTRSLLERQDPVDELLHIGIGHRGIRRHRDLAPHADATLLHLLDQLGLGGLVAAILVRHVLVGRADHLLVDRVAREAVVFLRQVFLRSRGQRGERGDSEKQHGRLHRGSLQVCSKFTRSSMGGRQVTPRQSHPLTLPFETGLSSGAGKPPSPSASARTVVSGRYSRARAARQASTPSGGPRRTRTFGPASQSRSASAMAAKPAGWSRIAGWKSSSVRRAACA